MPIVADAAVAIRGDLSKFSGDLKKTEGQVQTLGGKLSAALSPKALIGGLAGGFAASKVLGFFGDAVQAASHLGETVSKVGAIFGKEAVPELEKWAETAADAFGQSKNQALDAAATFAIFGKSAGLAGEDLVGFSQELTVLASDFASFFDTSPEEAIVAIGAALRGESEPIRRYGVLLDEATLRQRAMKLGIIETTTQALTPQQRVLAAQAEILAQTSDAQGDFQRTSEGLANTQRKLAAEMDDVMVEIGQELLPIMLELTKAAKDGLIPAFKSALPVLKVLAEKILPLLAIGLGIKLVLAFKAAQAAGVASALAVKAAWGAALFGIPLLIDALSNATLDAQLEAEKAAYRAGTAMERTSAAISAESARWAGIAAAELAAGADEVTAGAQKGLVAPTEQAMKEARQKAYAEAHEIPGAISDAFISAQNDLDDGLDALKKLMDESLSDIEKIAHAKAILADPAIAKGLLDERFDVRDATQQIVDEQTAILEGLESGAYDAAVDSGTTLAEQLRLQENEVSRAMADMLRGARHVLETFDPTITPTVVKPPVPSGGGSTAGPLPIRNLQVGAWEIPRNEVANLHAGEMVVPPDAAAALRKWFGGAVAASSTVSNYNLNVTGRLPVDDAQDAIWELRRLAGVKRDG